MDFFLFAIALSSVKRVLIMLNHRFSISVAACSKSGLDACLMRRSLLSERHSLSIYRWVVSGGCGKGTSALPSRRPKFLPRQFLFVLLHRICASRHTSRCPGALHLNSMCSMSSAILHLRQIPLSSYPASFVQNFRTLWAPCSIFQRKSDLGRLKALSLLAIITLHNDDCHSCQTCSTLL
ncbi:hypothetical protein QCA50_018553 [Cerrena zonata]|uniref:Secreted protein n=1 Tax=Cerrena zonata TaxID=2478898 RepID=A0AAW0FMK4_9APHY